MQLPPIPPHQVFMQGELYRRVSRAHYVLERHLEQLMDECGAIPRKPSTLSTDVEALFIVQMPYLNDIVLPFILQRRAIALRALRARGGNCDKASLGSTISLFYLRAAKGRDRSLKIQMPRTRPANYAFTNVESKRATSGEVECKVQMLCEKLESHQTVRSTSSRVSSTHPRSRRA